MQESDSLVNQCKVNIPMPNTCRSMLKQIAEDSDQSMAHVVRSLIGGRHRMLFDNTPLCATGQRCLCTQMHMIRIKDDTTDQERVDRQNEKTTPEPAKED